MKKLITIMCAFFMLFALTACKHDEQETAETQPVIQAREADIRVTETETEAETITATLPVTETTAPVTPENSAESGEVESQR